MREQPNADSQWWTPVFTKVGPWTDEDRKALKTVSKCFSQGVDCPPFIGRHLAQNGVVVSSHTQTRN